MRTCAAHILAHQTADDFTVYRDAADLLIEASNMLDAVPTDAVDLLTEARNMLEATPAPPGEPMEIIPPVAPRPSIEFGLGSATWLAPGDTLPKANPYRSANTCPNCDSRAHKTVRRYKNRLTLECPACGQQWDYAARS
ncbi:MAG TPA: hypothetical protein VNH80_04895 [Burkholderiales bacterium]|nr:hypothetical protein [Burkholderiales bacterium]